MVDEVACLPPLPLLSDDDILASGYLGESGTKRTFGDSPGTAPEQLKRIFYQHKADNSL